jgi:PTS system nitrogen regulatory IIA component
MEMEIADFLSPADAVVNANAPDKTRLLGDLCRRAAATLKLDPGRITTDILKREDLGSTGMGGGIAIPHARIADLKKPFGVLATLRSPIDFDAIDREPVDIVFLLLLPTKAAGEQLNVLALVARKLRDADIVRDARRAPDAAALFAVIAKRTK